MLAFALAATLAMALAATGVALHADEPRQVAVLNPESYPLVGGVWTVDLDVGKGGDLAVSATGGTAFGEDIEFASLHSQEDGARLTPSWDGGALRFDGVREGKWEFEVRVLTAGPHHLRFDMAWGETAYASNTASLADVTSTTANGTYGVGGVIDVRINFTEPVSLDRFAITDGSGDATGSGTFDVLDAPLLITTTTIGGSVYALVASISDDGVQIIDITDPASPAATASVTHDSDFDELDGAFSVATATIDGYHYALVASLTDDGVQIINITNPASPTATASVTHDSDFDELDAPRSIVTTAIGTSTYALVAAATDDGVQIIDITDPASPAATASVAHGAGGFDTLDGAYSVATATIDGSHYALVAAEASDGVQIIDITTPASPTATASVTDGDTDSDGNTFGELNGPRYITTITIGTSIYALVAGYADDGVQIIDITTPTDPKATASVQDDTTANPTDFDRLDGARGISTVAIGDSIYALVTAEADDGVQIINITDPASPTAVTSVVDSERDSSSVFQELDGAYASATTSAGGRHYALVTSSTDDGVQIIDITDPANPFDALAPYVEMDTATEPGRAGYVGLEGGSRAIAFEYVVRPGDSSSDLDYVGTGSLHLGHNVLEDTSDSTDLSGLLLPVPGAPHSLSHNRDIRIVTGSGGNTDPVLGAIGAKSKNELTSLTFTATATDDDNDTLEFSLGAGAPTGASITSGGAFSWTPSESQDGTHTITIQVEDGNGGSDSEDVTVTINEVNRSPVATSPGTQTVSELLPLSFTVTASDPDVINGVDDAIDFALGPNSPPGASISPATGLFSWTPTEQQDGTYNMVVQVSDGDMSAAVTFPVTVSEVNEDPVLNPIGSKSVNKLEALTFTATASDVDVISGTADTLTFSLPSGPTGASITQFTGVFSWTPTAGQVGTHTITFQVEDGAGATDSEAVTVTVSDGDATFATTWDATASPYTVSIPLEVHSGETLTIDWGDGTSAVDVTSDGTQSHTYSASGEYQVNMTGGLSRINLHDSDSTASKLVSIDQWGDIEWTTMDGAFRGASGMEYAATDAPDLSGVTSMRYMFFDVAAFDGDLSGWDVSSVANMVATFYGTSFNGDISGWDVSSVTTMQSMFYNAGSFNQDLSSWNTASVTDTSSMFGNFAGSFNQDLQRPGTPQA